MSFSNQFLTELAKEKQLSDREAGVFVALFGEDRTRYEIAERLHMSETAIGTCLSGVYQKFQISGNGPVKESRLKDELKRRENLWQYQQTINKLPPKPDALVKQVQARCREKILLQHSKIRLLSGEEIGVNQLYVDVYLLNRQPCTFQISESKLLKTFDLRNDRLGLGDRIKRDPGFKVANDEKQLVVLGKPGSGKTTFLKHLAVDWCNGNFQPNLIAVLIEFRRIRDGDWDLLAVIAQELGVDSQELESLLKDKRLLVLMDGLDEVPTTQLRQSVQAQLQDIVEYYPENRFVLTCRTQIFTLIPDRFTSVEVAEFHLEQVQQFTQNWFRASKLSETKIRQQCEALNSITCNNLALKELTSTPVLLSLMCLIFQDEGEMPSDIAWLYQKGIRLLLSKWNESKEIHGWEIGSEAYRKLNIEQKELLLRDIAARKFENPKNFVLFQQEEIVGHITQFLQLSNSREGVMVLKAIEAQHGLLIERADELWSFSHLTFQEHFTVRWLNQLPSEELAGKIADPHWQKIVGQLVRSQQPADGLMKILKSAIDQSIATSLISQRILSWVQQKFESFKINRSYATDFREHTSVRAFYLVLALAFARDLTLTYETAFALPRVIALEHDLVALDRDHYSLPAHNSDISLDRDLACALIRACARDLDYDFAFTRDLDNELQRRLKELRGQLPNRNHIRTLRRWWTTEGSRWTLELRQTMIAYRNLGHDWQLDTIEQQSLQRYYDANRFLVKLLNIEGAVSINVRAEISETLMLPISKL